MIQDMSQTARRDTIVTFLRSINFYKKVKSGWVKRQNQF